MLMPSLVCEIIKFLQKSPNVFAKYHFLVCLSFWQNIKFEQIIISCMFISSHSLKSIICLHLLNQPKTLKTKSLFIFVLRNKTQTTWKAKAFSIKDSCDDDEDSEDSRNQTCLISNRWLIIYNYKWFYVIVFLIVLFFLREWLIANEWKIINALITSNVICNFPYKLAN